MSFVVSYLPWPTPEICKGENKTPLIEGQKKHQDDEIPKNVNHIGAPIKGDEKKEKPKSGWWNKG